MAQHDLAKIKSDYERDGYVSGIKLLSDQDAKQHRHRLESAEAEFGNMHYKSKAHTLLTSPLELATMPGTLDIVEQMIGPDILIYNVTYIIKEANTPAHVSWHQDLTFWGLSHDDQVSMWLALSPATPESGSQTIEGVDESKSVMCPLKTGEASFHHGWTMHASMPNNSNDRRIGLNIQYLASHVRQTKHDLDTAMLARGNDPYNNFGTDIPAEIDLDPAAIQRQAELEALHVETAGQA